MDREQQQALVWGAEELDRAILVLWRVGASRFDRLNNRQHFSMANAHLELAATHLRNAQQGAFIHEFFPMGHLLNGPAIGLVEVLQAGSACICIRAVRRKLWKLEPELLIPPPSGGGLTSEDVARLARNPVTWIVLFACTFAFFWYVRSLGGAWRYR